MKKLLIGIGAVVFIGTIAVGAGLWWLSGNVDRLVKEAIERYGSEMVGAKVAVGSVELRASGEGVVKNLVIENPKGFRTPHAAKVGQLEVAIDLPSLASDVIRIKRTSIVGPDLIYERGDAMTNIDTIQKNINAYLGPSKGSSNGPKLIVDQLTIRQARARASAAFLAGKTVEVALPDLTLRDIGKARGGVPPGELGRVIVNAMEKQLTASISFDRLKSAVGGTVDSASKAVRGLFLN